MAVVAEKDQRERLQEAVQIRRALSELQEIADDAGKIKLAMNAFVKDGTSASIRVRSTAMAAMGYTVVLSAVQGRQSGVTLEKPL